MAIKTWGGGSGNTNDQDWNNPLNWTDDTIPVNGDSVLFDGTALQAVTIGPTSSVVLDSITVTSGALSTVINIENPGAPNKTIVVTGSLNNAGSAEQKFCGHLFGISSFSGKWRVFPQFDIMIAMDQFFYLNILNVSQDESNYIHISDSLFSSGIMLCPGLKRGQFSGSFTPPLNILSSGNFMTFYFGNAPGPFSFLLEYTKLASIYSDSLSFVNTTIECPADGMFTMFGNSLDVNDLAVNTLFLVQPLLNPTFLNGNSRFSSVQLFLQGTGAFQVFIDNCQNFNSFSDGLTTACFSITANFCDLFISLFGNTKFFGNSYNDNISDGNPFNGSAVLLFPAPSPNAVQIISYEQSSIYGFYNQTSFADWTNQINNYGEVVIIMNGNSAFQGIVMNITANSSFFRLNDFSNISTNFVAYFYGCLGLEYFDPIGKVPKSYRSSF